MYVQASNRPLRYIGEFFMDVYLALTVFIVRTSVVVGTDHIRHSEFTSILSYGNNCYG